MSRSTPRRHQNDQPPLQDAQQHPHDHGHGRTRSQQLQLEAQRQHQHQHQQHQQQHHQQQQYHRQHSQHYPQQQQHQHQPFPITSDYESDTPHYMASDPSTQPPPPAHAAATAAAVLAGRTNTELNLGVLRRYLPSITTILSIAANAVVYTFQPPSEWKRATVEGTMFVCSQRKTPGEAGDTGCLFILNRKGLQNFILDLDNVSDFELAGDLLIFKLDNPTHQVLLETG
ncbi:hypothetical protein F5B17DRAFT_416839, partial [Nemania serpens]